MSFESIIGSLRRVENIRIGASFPLPPGSLIVIGNNPPSEIGKLRPRRANVILSKDEKLGNHTVTMAHLSKEGSKGNIVVERPSENTTEVVSVYDPQADLTVELRPGEHYIFTDAQNVNVLIRSKGCVWRIISKDAGSFKIIEGEAIS